MDEQKNYENPYESPEVDSNEFNYQTEDSEPVNPTPTQVVEPQKSNFIAGLVGAFLGSLIGCVLWVIIYRLGYIAGIAGAITAICAMKGYELLGKKLDVKGVISCVVIMILMIFFANKLAWSWEIYDVFTTEYGYEITFFDAFLSADEIIKASELTSSYYKDLIIGYGLTALASFGNIVNAFKASKAQ